MKRIVLAGVLMVLVAGPGRAAAAQDTGDDKADLTSILNDVRTDLDRPATEAFELKDGRAERTDGGGIVIEGKLVNTTKDERAAPKVEIIYLDADDQTVGERVVRPFKSRIPARSTRTFEYIEQDPPGATKTARVRVTDEQESADDRSRWVYLPDHLRGLWANDCSTPNRSVLLTGFGKITLIRDTSGSGHMIDGSRFTAFLADDGRGFHYQTADTSQAQVIEVTDSGLTIGPNGEVLERCDAVPPDLSAAHGEAINGGLALDQAIAACRNQKASCPARLMAFADVSGNKELSVAEISRVLRIAMYFGSIFGDDDVNHTEDLTGRTLAMHAAAPLVV